MLSSLFRLFHFILQSVSSVSSVAQPCLTLCDPTGLKSTRFPCPSPTPRACSNSCTLSQWCHPDISSSVIPFSSYLQSFSASGSFQWVSTSHQVTKVLAFQVQHQSFQWIFGGLISFRTYWFYIVAVQVTLKNLLQHHSSKASILRHSAFFIVQLSHPITMC